jgi:hypothetical protein
MEVELLIDCISRPCFIYYQAYPEMIKGALLSDAIVILSSLNVIAGVRRVVNYKILD